MKISELFTLVAFIFLAAALVVVSTFSIRAYSGEAAQLNTTEGKSHVSANTFDSWFMQYIFSTIFSDSNYRRIESNGLRGTYFAENGMAVFSRVDQTVDFDWGNASPSSYLLDDDNFAAIWEGEVVPDVSGTYTFEVTADDGVRLYIDDELVLESWENQPEATHVGSVSLVEGRRHAIRLEYYEAHSLASVSLKWRSATQPLEVVPYSNLHPTQSPASQAPEDFPNNEPANGEEGDPGEDEQSDEGSQQGGSDGEEAGPEPGTGLRATFFDYDGNLLTSRIDSAIDFNWERRAPANNVPSDYFTAVWEGEVRPEYSEEYSFTASVDDGVRLYIDDELVLESWENQPTTDYTGSIRLTAGEYYDIRFEYYEANWHAEARLQWQSASQQKEVVPQENLYPSSDRSIGSVDRGGTDDSGSRTADGNNDEEPQEPEPGTGLRATFFDFDSNQLASRIDPEVNFNWGYNSPSSRVPDDYFTAVWEGQVRTESSGTHKFQVTADDGVRLYVGDELIIEDWTSHPSRTYIGSVNLGEGKHNIRLEYFENHSIAELRLRWQENGQFVAIPQENLYPRSSRSSDPGRDLPIDDDGDSNENEEEDDQLGDDSDDDSGYDDEDASDQGSGSPASVPSGSFIGPQEVQSTSLSSGDYFVSPSGSGDNCSLNSPCGISTAISLAGPGDVVFLRGGVYRVGSSGIRFSQSGRSDAPITFESYPGELAVFDGSSHSDGSDVYIRVTGDWNVIRRIEIRNMPRSGIWIGGNYNLIDGVVSHGNFYSGIHVFSPYNSYPYGDYGSYNIIQNSTSYDNFDEGSDANGGDADGIAVSSGEGNKVFNNRIYYNSDDGIDVWRSTNTEVAYNIVYDNGRANGNGNGIKSGGQSPSRGTLVHHNIAYGNEQTGIDYNTGEDITFYNNTSYNNGYGYSGDDGVLLRNNISFENGRNWVSNARQDYNSWNGGVSVSPSDFLSLDPDSSNFLKLAPDSDLIDAGIGVGFDYEGRAPDLGALEY